MMLRCVCILLRLILGRIIRVILAVMSTWCVNRLPASILLCMYVYSRVLQGILLAVWVLGDSSCVSVSHKTRHCSYVSVPTVVLSVFIRAPMLLSVCQCLPRRCPWKQRSPRRCPCKSVFTTVLSVCATAFSSLLESSNSLIQKSSRAKVAGRFYLSSFLIVISLSIFAPFIPALNCFLLPHFLGWFVVWSNIFFFCTNNACSFSWR